MKLQKLTIHNIASIKDATIDFEAQPLSDSEVFLISGETGSGKSTILDAICLALFADTPRLDGTEMQGKTTVGNQEITLSDPRQLLRRDAVEASVSLTFTGNDNKHYLAEWKVERAYKKVDGNLKGKDWKLTDLDDDHLYDKDDEIRTQMTEAVGLAFDQFCRTTMLAQGEFTRFLNCKDNEKAAILEKITGTDTYAKVGKKIFEITADKKRKFDDVNLLLGGISNLNDTQLKAKNDELSDLDTQLGEINEAYNADKAKLDWINDENRLQQAVSETAQTHNEAKKEVESDEYKASDQMVKQWNATIEARGWMVAKENAEQRKKTQQEALDELADVYATIIGGYQYAMQAKQNKEEEIKEPNTYLESEKDRATVYENAQTIVGKLEIIADGRKLIDDEAAIIKECDKDLGEYGSQIDGAKTRRDTCKEMLDAQKDTIDKFAKAMRLKLQVGDTCPVCGQTIAAELPHEEALEELVKGLKEKYEEAEKEYEAINEKVNTANRDKQTAEKLVETKKSEVEGAEKVVESYISGVWPIDWKEKPKEFSDDLKRKAKKYSDNVEQKRKLKESLEKLTNDCKDVEQVIGEILQLMPAWKEKQPAEVKELPNLLWEANNVRSKTSTACELLKQAKQAIADNSQPLEDFLKEHNEISLEMLKTLNGHSQQAIAALQSTLKQKNDKVLTTKTLMGRANEDHEAHLAKKPELTDDDTEEALKARLKDNETKKSELNQQVGSIQKELEDDQKNRKKIGDLTKEAERYEAEYKRWSSLNELLGDATGSKFRRIAQSYVLGSLIHSANSYMKTLTDRYTLKVEPGTFVISIEDAYQGFASRAASTISGGESFIVSLALALALSDIGEKLKVDTLFIDEGFGTLSGEPLQNAINTLRSLHSSTGRQVGIISHVKDLREKIPVKIMVEREGHSSSSTVTVVPEMS